ncbi:MAG TPA: peptide transporter [Clostridiales bacterium]|nr:peptide transporter [Clostridiales bacterium]
MKANKQLTVRSILIGMAGSAVITASSMYVALRMGALPWPTIFVAVLSMALLKLLGKTSLNEINVTHTAMSAGSMVAGGMAFTLPAAWILDRNADIGLGETMMIAMAGTLLGLVFSALYRNYFIEVQPQPYPIGSAAAQTVIAGDEGGAKARSLFAAMGLSVVFTFLRDWTFAGGKTLINAFWMSKKLLTSGFQFGFWFSPMAVAIGYIIGPLYMGVWFLGAILGYWILMPAGIRTGLFADAAAADVFRQSLGMGLMIGTGFGILIKGILPRMKQIYSSILLISTESADNKNRKRMISAIPIVFTAIAALIAIFTRISPLASILLIPGVWITASMAAQTTGQTGINPMEVFGVILLLLIKLILPTGQVEAILIAAVVAIACGLTGDIMNDFKAGHILGTKPKNQFISETAGGIVGAVVASVALFAMLKAYGEFGGDALPAPQARLVAQMAGGIGNVTAFVIGIVAGTLFYVIKIPAATLGIGVYLPVIISTTAFLGALIALGVKKFLPKRTEQGTVIASGVFGGEGITGVAIALIRMFTGG